MNKSFLNYRLSSAINKIGVKSSSGFYWARRGMTLHWDKDLFTGMTNFEATFIPAYTDADLMDVLPAKLSFKRKTNVEDSYDLKIIKSSRTNNSYFVEYENTNSALPSFAQIPADTEVEAKALMLLHLHKKNLLNN